MLTYETLFDLLRKEKSREDLQQLPEEFYAEVSAFLTRKQAESVTHGAAGQRAAIELTNTRKILKELYERRERKTLLLALNKARTESAIIDASILLPQERLLFDEVVRALRERKSDVFDMIEDPAHASPALTTRAGGATSAVTTGGGASVGLSGTSSAPAEPPAEHARVKFLAAVPKFVGKDLSVYGPFSEGDEAELPSQIVEILVKKKRAARIS